MARGWTLCLLLSSLTSILGGVGQAAYASSNIFMDAFARRHNRSNQTPWLSVNWDVWRMQNDAWNGPGLGRTLAELGMTAEEAITAMEVALSVNHTSQLIVSTGDLQARIRQWIKRESIEGRRESTQLGPTQSTVPNGRIYRQTTRRRGTKPKRLLRQSGKMCSGSGK